MHIKKLRGASALALLIGTSGFGSAFAQQAIDQTIGTTSGPQQAAPQTAVDQTAPAAADQSGGEKVVVTGSLIATTPEDAPKPVEVYSLEDLKQQGTPSVTEFVRSLTLSYGDDLGFGQASPDIPEGSGFGNANMRGLGSNATLVLMNGQKLAPWNGSFGADINTVPMEALQAVEVLKGGASATYGAGAVGGVINFRTRRDIDAPQITVEKQFYDGSDGYYKVDFLTGWVGDTSNLLVSLSRSHEDSLSATERDFSSQPFGVNPGLLISPSHLVFGSNPGSFQTFAGNFHTGTGTINPFLASFVPLVVSPATFPGIRDLRAASAEADCTAIGGIISNVMQPNANITNFANANCGVPLANFQNIVNENTTTRAYAELNADISDDMEVFFNVNYSMSETTSLLDPSKQADVQAIDRSTSVTGGRAGFASGLCGGCNYVIPVSVQTYSPAVGTSATQAPGTPSGTFFRNPFIDDFMTRTGTSPALLPPTGALYMGLNWRPFLFGGNPLTESGFREEKYQRENIAISSGLRGTFTEDTWVGPLLNGINYEFTGQYNQYMQTTFDPDIFASRLQNSMLGYGGPNCNAVDRVPTDYTSAATYNRTVGIQSNTAPGTGGCQWFNPFASAWDTSIVNGAANPQFNSGTPNLPAGATPRPTGYANPVDLVDWMSGVGWAEFKLESVTFNGLVSGTVSEDIFALPGGEIGWAFGSEWRQVEGRRITNDDNDDEAAMNIQDCVWPDPVVVELPSQQNPSPGMPGCTTSGARYGDGQIETVGVAPPWYYDNQTFAAFGEFNFPVLDNVNIQANFRHEEWNGGDLTGDIYTVAGKWDITDNLWVRSDYGTNYRADAALELRPGAVTNTTVGQNRFGTGTQKNQSTTVSPGITPEDDRTFNFGIGWESDLGEGRIRANVNFFEILIDGQLATTSATTILNNVFGANDSECQEDRTNQAECGVGNTATGLPGLPAGSNNSPLQLVDCNARLIDFVVLSTPCVQGVTNSTALTEIERFQVNGPGFITNGIDYTIDFAYPLFDGTLTAQVTATQNLIYKSKGYFVNGVLFEASGNRLGYANGVLRSGNDSRRWRANAQVGWANDMHNVILRANYSSGTSADYAEFRAIRNPIIANNPLTAINETAFSTYGLAPKEYLDFDLNYIYTAPFWQDLELRATVLNIFDKDPSPSQQRSGYYPGTGNPRGRIIEVGVTKKF